LHPVGRNRRVHGWFLSARAPPFVDTGTAPRFKLVAALKRRADLDRAAFKTWWLEKHAPLVVAFPELARYQVNLVPAGEEEGFADGVAEVCFNDLETLLRITSSQQVKTVQQDSVVHSAAINRLLVQEHPIVCGHYATPRRLSEAPCRPDSTGLLWLVAGPAPGAGGATLRAALLHPLARR
jgi:uncharacterized protein (TIGR02118 family)